MSKLDEVMMKATLTILEIEDPDQETPDDAVVSVLHQVGSDLDAIGWANKLGVRASRILALAYLHGCTVKNAPKIWRSPCAE